MAKNRDIDLSTLALGVNSSAVVEGAGKNIIPPPERESLWRAYLEKFKDPIIVVLIVVFFFSVMLSLYEILMLGYSWSVMIESLGVLLALLLATGVGFIFEVKAGREFDVLNKIKDSRPVKVVRVDAEGELNVYLVEKQDVVVGDIVRLEPGDEVPADGELLESIDLRVDESDFTGEPYVNKYADEESFDSEATYASNFMLRGSTIIEGSAVMQVVAVGVDTEEGHGVKRASEGSDVETPLNQQLDQLGRMMSKVSFVLASLIIVGRLLYYGISGDLTAEGVTWVDILQFVLASVMIAVTLIVVAVPEGLPMSVTVSLAMSMRRMLKENSLVRKLHACETMGAATVICSDKTGTLTQNRMSVMEIEVGGGDALSRIVECMAVNSTAELTKDEDGSITPIGNPTEVALLMWLRGRDIEYKTLRNKYKTLSQEPFSTETKYMATVAQCNDVPTPVRFIKGAPEVILGMCNAMAEGLVKQSIEATLRNYQSRAMRTLAFAVEQGGVTTFLGIVGIADPIREDVAEAIDT